MAPAQQTGSTPFLVNLLALPTCALDVVLLVLCWTHRTDAAIASPWSVLPIGIFLLYAFATGWLFVVFKELGKPWKRTSLILHAFTSWGVALLVYTLGFGYDPFIHQAAEQTLRETGHIGLTSPLYAGQYYLVAALSFLTRLPVHVVDVVLVPILASTLLPTLLLRRFPHEGALLLFLFTVPFFTFTVPYHLALLCFLALLLTYNRPFHPAATIALALAALAIHPLAGIPAAALALTQLFPKTTPQWVTPIILFIITAGGLVGAFITQALLAGGQILTPNSDTLFIAAAVLFGNPYATAPDSWLKTAYAIFRALPYLFITIGLWGYATHDGWKKIFTHPPVPIAAALLISALFIAGHIRLPNILPLEQFEFALRLVNLLPILFLPGVIYAYERLRPRISSNIRLAAIALPFALIATCQWFLTYPQWNSVAHVSGLSMGREELEAVQGIEQDARGAHYTALAHPMMSLAALRTFGFDREQETAWGRRYFYPIPTGNELFALYQDLLSAEDPTALLPLAFEFIQTDRIYVAVPTEWDPEKTIRDRLTPAANRTWSVGERITIFLFTTQDPDRS